MAKTPEYRQIRLDTFPDIPDWAKVIATAVNKFMRESINTMSTLTFKDNFDSSIQTIVFATTATYLTGDFTTILLKKPSPTVSAVLLLKITNLSTPTAAFLTGISPSIWTTDDMNVKVKYITGLANSTRYSVTFLVI